MGKRKEEFEPRLSLLSDQAILWHIKEGNIIIDPFDRENLGTASYDVSLGEWYYAEKDPVGGIGIYSPYSEEDVRRVWGEPRKAEVASEYCERYRISLPGGIKPDDKVIWLPPGETFLCHTLEFIGGRDIVTTLMKARSSIGRNFIEVCKCAGWGDVGYINRWTMEVTNNSKHYTIPLVVGRRVAQMAFFEVAPTSGEDYSRTGKYQTTKDLKEIEANWRPEDMLPKMWKDREVRSGEGIFGGEKTKE